MTLPDDVFASVVAERAKFGAVPTPTELGILLNRVAWTHRDHKNGKFGVSRKVGGAFFQVRVLTPRISTSSISPGVPG